MNNSSIQHHLESGDWVVGEISDQLKSRLSKNQPTIEQEPGLTARSLAHYKRLNLFEVKIQSDSIGLEDLNVSAEARSAIDSILNREIQGARLSSGFSISEREKLKSALDLIRKHDSSIELLLNKLVQTFLKAENVHFRSASHPHLMGSIILGTKATEQSVEKLAVSVVHELAHQELYMLNLLDRLVIKAFDHNEIHAPFQGRMRPPIGRLHSMWALYRMVQFQRKIGVCIEKHANLLKQNCQAFDSKELTEFGKFLVKMTEKQVA